jgi:predicted DNA-binding protein (MmcQ/YjbR family)
MPNRKAKPAARARPSRKGRDLREIAKALRRYALGLPGASEHFPWGERVAKVGGKVFVFLGMDPKPDGEMSFSVKLPESAGDALALPFTRPTGYGLGKAGWVTATFSAKDAPPVGILEEWVLESYRAVAPKKKSGELRKEARKS